jgi:hypothetical protein
MLIEILLGQGYIGAKINWNCKPFLPKKGYDESKSFKYLISSMLQPAVLENKIANMISDTIHTYNFQTILASAK